MKKNTFIIIASIVVVVGALIYWFKPINKIPLNLNSKTPSNAELFKLEYSGAAENNKFVFKSAEEIIDILKNGTGLVYLGFPECPWCQKYVIYLNEVAKEQKLEKIYYYNIRQIRSDNTPEYKEMVSLIGEGLDKDKDGNPRIFVPELVAVKNGAVVARDNTSSLNSSEKDGTPDEWWTEERIEAIKAKFREMIKPVNVCEEACNS